MDIQTAQIATVNMEIAIDASPAEVWKALTANIGQWWPADFYAGGTEGARTFAIEERPGGRMFEEWDGGGGLLWGTVVGIEPRKMLQVLGHVFPDWGGPTEWYGTWTLEQDGTGTKLAFSEHGLGKLSEDSMLDKYKGWRFLWATLKAHVEGTPAPEWS